MSSHVQDLTLLHDQYPTGDKYPFTLPILHQTSRLEFTSPVSIFVGENGTGKSTLLEALARACNVHIWKLTNNTRRFHFNEYEEALHRCLKVTMPNGRVPGSFFGSEIFKDFKLLIDEWAVSDPGQLKYFGGESLVTKSHGQSMMTFFRHRYRIRGVYFLDEPETGLSPTSQLELLDIINENSRDGHAQFFIATHSPILLSCAQATLFSFDDIPVREVRFQDTNHFHIYRRFFQEQMEVG